MSQSGRGITIDQNGETVYKNTDASTHSVLVINTDAAVILRFVGFDPSTGNLQTYAQGYDWGPGKEYGFDVAPGESICAIAAPAASALVNFYVLRSTDDEG